jgi:hypothetical protein
MRISGEKEVSKEGRTSKTIRAKNKLPLHSAFFQMIFKQNDFSTECTTHNGSPVLFVSDHHALKARLVRPQTTTQK